jgi:adenylate cyclase
MSRVILLHGVLPVAAAALLALSRPAFSSGLDNAAYDTLLRWTHAAQPDARIAIVDVDERSLSAIGQWPWRRDVFGRLVARLRDMGAATIALDIVFAEPDRYQGLVAAEDPSTAGGRHRTPDDWFAESLRPGKVVLGYAMTFGPGVPAAKPCVLVPLNLAIVHASDSWSSGGEAGDDPFFQATGAVCNLPALAEAAGASGFLNAAPDADGILRRVPVVIELDGLVYPSLALAAVSAATGARDASLRIATVNAASLTLDHRTVPLDAKSNLLIRYRGRKRMFPYVSAADVLSGRAPGDALKNKIVFVGTTALGTREVVATPLDTLFAGVEVQATLADNLLQQDFIHRPVSGSTLESLAVIALGIAVTLLVAASGLVSGAIAGVAGLAALWVGAGWLLSTRGVFLSPLFPTAAAVGAYAAMTIAKFTVERDRAEVALKKVESAVQLAQTAGQQKANAQRLMIETLLSLTETRDAETGRHSRRTSQYAKLLADELARDPSFGGYFTPERIALLSSLAPLHDIGKVGVPDAVLNKPGALTPGELAEMRRHPVYGREVILRAEKEAGINDDAILAMAKEIVYTHHERWDGAGYPEGLKGPDIPVPGRVMAVVDVYDACTTRTLYRPSMSHQQVIEFIVSGKGSHFDPAVVDAFVTVAPVLLILAEEEDLRR